MTSSAYLPSPGSGTPPSPSAPSASAPEAAATRRKAAPKPPGSDEAHGPQSPRAAQPGAGGKSPKQPTQMEATLTAAPGPDRRLRKRKGRGKPRRPGPAPKLYRQKNGRGQLGHLGIRVTDATTDKRVFYSMETESDSLASRRAQEVLNRLAKGQSEAQVRKWLEERAMATPEMRLIRRTLRKRTKRGELLVGEAGEIFLEFELPVYCTPYTPRARSNYLSAFYALAHTALVHELGLAPRPLLPRLLLARVPLRLISAEIANVCLINAGQGQDGAARSARETTATTQIQTMRGMFSREFVVHLRGLGKSVPPGFARELRRVQVDRRPAQGYLATPTPELARIRGAIEAAVQEGDPGALPLVLALYGCLTARDIRAAQGAWLTPQGELALPHGPGQRPRAVLLAPGIAPWLRTQPPFLSGSPPPSPCEHERAIHAAVRRLAALGIPGWTRPLHQLRHLGVVLLGARLKPLEVVAATGTTSPEHFDRFFGGATLHEQIARQFHFLASDLGHQA